MRKNFGKKPWLLPQPVLLIATHNEDETPDVMNAAWGGMYDADQIMICLSQDHRTTENIKRTHAFTLQFADQKHVIEADYAGIVSMNQDPDKFQKTGFQFEPSEFVNAPLLTTFPIHMECELNKFNEDGILIGNIINVSIDSSLLDPDGNVCTDTYHPIVFDPIKNVYRCVKEVCGHAFQDGLKRK